MHQDRTPTRRLGASTIAAFATPVSLGVALAVVLPPERFPSESLHAVTETATLVIAGLAAVIAMRAYARDGSVRLLAFSGALGAYAAITFSESALATTRTLDEFHPFGSVALSLLGTLMLGLRVSAVTRAVEARRHMVTFVGVVLLLVALTAFVTGLKLDPESAADPRWHVADQVLDAVAFVTLSAAAAWAIRALHRGERLPRLVPVGLALLAAQAALMPLAGAWSATWWLAHASGLAGCAALAWSAFLIALACERTESAVNAAEARSDRLASLGTLVAGVAHEINNPLMYVRGNIELAIMDVEDAQEALRAHGVPNPPDLAHTAQQLRVSLQGADRIARITRSLRAVARQNGGTHEVVDLASVVRSAGELVTIGNPDHVTVSIDAGDRPVMIKGNEAELHQVVLNLTRNAVEAVGDTPGEVHVRVTHRDRLAEITVTDTGPGIAEDVKRNLFTPFFTTKHQGTGLGLAIVHAIVEEHAGHIIVESEPGTGTTFRLRFPVATPNGVEERLESLF